MLVSDKNSPHVTGILELVIEEVDWWNDGNEDGTAETRGLE